MPSQVRPRLLVHQRGRIEGARLQRGTGGIRERGAVGVPGGAEQRGDAGLEPRCERARHLEPGDARRRGVEMQQDRGDVGHGDAGQRISRTGVRHDASTCVATEPRREVDPVAVTARAHDEEVEAALVGHRGDRLGRVADGVGEGRLDALLLEEGADRAEHGLRVVVVETAHRRRADEGRGAVRHGEHRMDDGVCVRGAEPLVVRGDVGQHALGVVAAVDGDQDLHRCTSCVVRVQSAVVRRREPCSGSRPSPHARPIIAIDDSIAMDAIRLAPAAEPAVREPGRSARASGDPVADDPEAQLRVHVRARRRRRSRGAALAPAAERPLVRRLRDDDRARARGRARRAARARRLRHAARDGDVGA